MTRCDCAHHHDDGRGWDGWHRHSHSDDHEHSHGEERAKPFTVHPQSGWTGYHLPGERRSECRDCRVMPRKAP